MTEDASLPPNAPMTNGTLTPSAHGEADASSTLPHSHSQPRPSEEEHRAHTQEHTRQSLREVCAEIHSRVEAFLAVPSTDDGVLRSTQDQTKIAIGVIEKALEDYEFEHLSLSYNGGKDCLVLLLLYVSVLHRHFSKRDRSRRKHDSNTTPQIDPEQRQQKEEEFEDRDDKDTSIDFPSTILSIYAKPPDPFPLVTSFVESSSALYHLDLVHISTNPGSSIPKKTNSHSSPPPPPLPPQQEQQQQPTAPPNHHHQQQHQNELPKENKVVSFRDAFSLYLSQTHPSCKAIFVGTRRTDPHGHSLSAFQMTDGLWPRFMRVHPVLDFGLGMVWTFLRHPIIRYGLGSGVGDGDGDSKGKGTLGTVGYCEMYDQGYTSLGGVGDTLRNPVLRDSAWEGGYRPAWTLAVDEEERAGRE